MSYDRHNTFTQRKLKQSEKNDALDGAASLAKLQCIA
jgi:hypothetical protein